MTIIIKLISIILSLAIIIATVSIQVTAYNIDDDVKHDFRYISFQGEFLLLMILEFFFLFMLLVSISFTNTLQTISPYHSYLKLNYYFNHESFKSQHRREKKINSIMVLIIFILFTCAAIYNAYLLIYFFLFH